MKGPTIRQCFQRDFLLILDSLPEFWGDLDMRCYHHPMFLHEFGNTSFVIEEHGQVIAYLFGFHSQVDSLGYVHLVAVKKGHRRRGYANILYRHFIEHLRGYGINSIKAITTPTNEVSIRFHLSMGMRMVGDRTVSGITFVANYSGPGNDRVVFRMDF